MVRLAASQRVVRGQPIQGKGFSPHFKLLALCTAGRDTGGFGFETTALTEQLTVQLRLLESMARNGYHLSDIEVSLTDLTAGTRKPVLDSRVFAPLAEVFGEVRFGYDDDRTSGTSYYTDVSLAVSARDARGDRITFSDGGFTTWTRQLLGNAKERLLIGGLGLELTHRLFRD